MGVCLGEGECGGECGGESGGTNTSTNTLKIVSNCSPKLSSRSLSASSRTCEYSICTYVYWI